MSATASGEAGSSRSASASVSRWWAAVVEAEEVLRPGAGGGESDPQLDGIGGGELVALEQGGIALGEVAAGRERARARQEKLDPVRRGGIVSEQPQRSPVPPSRALRGTVGGFLAGLAQDGDGPGVPLPAGAFNMVGTFGGGCSTAAKGCGAPFVGTQEPTGRGGVVDGSPHEGVAEAESAGQVGPPDDTDGGQLVDGGERDGLDDSRGGGCELRLEGVAHDGCALKHEVCGVAELSQLVGERGGHRRGHAEVRGDPRNRQVPLVRRPRELASCSR